MKYLSPEIAALAKTKYKKSLINKGVSCGIFQDTDTKSIKMDVSLKKRRTA